MDTRALATGKKYLKTEIHKIYCKKLVRIREPIQIQWRTSNLVKLLAVPLLFVVPAMLLCLSHTNVAPNVAQDTWRRVTSVLAGQECASLSDRLPYSSRACPDDLAAKRP